MNRRHNKHNNNKAERILVKALNAYLKQLEAPSNISRLLLDQPVETSVIEQNESMNSGTISLSIFHNERKCGVLVLLRIRHFEPIGI